MWHPSTTLKEFVDGYDNALRKKVENENIADFKSFNSKIACVSKFSFEKKFQQLYTNTKFKEVQEEIKEVMYCSVDLIDVQIKCTRKCTSRMQYNGGASARSNPQGIVFLKANLNLN
jgi:hypothetical protein